MPGYARMAGSTLYHDVGPCRMEAEPAALIDPALRGDGIEWRRVIDVSVMIAERAGDPILARHVHAVFAS